MLREEGEVEGEVEEDEEDEEDRGGSAEPHRTFIFFLRGCSGPRGFLERFGLLEGMVWSLGGVLEGTWACCLKLQLWELDKFDLWIRGVQCQRRYWKMGKDILERLV